MNDWNKALALADSQDRGQVLFAAMLAADPDEARELVAHWWTSCEAWGNLLDDVLQALGDLGYVGERLPQAELLTVYRATGGMPPDGGSWTLDATTAKRFARMIASPRGMFLGIYSAAPIVWQAKVVPESVLGYFTDRNEDEVVLPHGAALAVEPRWRLG